MRPAHVESLDTGDPWKALALLERAIATDDPRALSHVNRGRKMTGAEIHDLVKARVRYLHGNVQRWATPLRTYRAGFGDCGNTARLILAFGKLHHIPGRLRIFVRHERDPGLLWKIRVTPAHVVAELYEGGRWRWAEAAIDAHYGEHTLTAARRLGVPTTIVEVPPKGARAGGRLAALPRALSGPWPWPGRYPAVVDVLGKRFDKSGWSWPYPGVDAQYRERRARDSLHMMVSGARWTITHADAVNPIMGSRVEHLVKDVVLPALAGGAPVGNVGSVPQEVPATKTPMSPADMWDAMGARFAARAGLVPSSEQLTVLMAQWMLETANGASMIQWNIGNVKHVDGDGLDWCCYGTTEGTDYTPQQGCFKAYADVDAGLDAFFDMFLGGRYASAWPAVIAGDIDAFSAAIRAKGYYTGKQSDYTAGMQARAKQLEALGLDPPSLDSSKLPALLAMLGVIGAGGAVAYGMDWFRYLG